MQDVNVLDIFIENNLKFGAIKKFTFLFKRNDNFDINVFLIEEV